jgi:hypothetical protein
MFKIFEMTRAWTTFHRSGTKKSGSRTSAHIPLGLFGINYVSVVGARASGDGVVMGADEDDRVRARRTETRDLEILADDAADLVGLALDMVALKQPLVGNVLRRRVQLVRLVDIAFTDRARRAWVKCRSSSTLFALYSFGVARRRAHLSALEH